jgi:transposase
MHAPLNARFATVLSRWFFQRHQSVLLHHRRSPEVNSGAATIGDSALTGNYGVARTVTYDRCAYRARNLIERFFNRIKHYRRIATRYDKLACSYMAFVRIVCAVISYRYM